MHQGNRDWLASLRIAHPEAFVDSNVLEIGSYDVNGTVRDYFSTKRYVGVDHAAGPCVDVVSEASKTVFEPEEFDVLVCMSVFEHDPDWAVGFEHNLQWIKPGGLIIICWGAEGNCPHAPYPWAIVPVADFVNAAKKWPIEILEAFFEGERFTADCGGAYDVLARKL